MKTKFLYIAALALLVSFTACENETPFDTQKPDDSPIILKPYNESGTGSFTYNLANPDTPLSDSVTVTPSKYTTVNWYLDGELVFTDLKIYMTFPVGKYNLTIEAVTEKGKRTERFGTITHTVADYGTSTSTYSTTYNSTHSSIACQCTNDTTQSSTATSANDSTLTSLTHSVPSLTS